MDWCQLGLVKAILYLWVNVFEYDYHPYYPEVENVLPHAKIFLMQAAEIDTNEPKQNQARRGGGSKAESG